MKAPIFKSHLKKSSPSSKKLAGPGQILGCALAQAHPITIIECYLLLIDARRSSVVLDSFKALFAKLFPQNRSDFAFPFCCFWVKKGGKDLNYKRLRSLWNYKSVCLTPQNRYDLSLIVIFPQTFIWPTMFKFDKSAEIKIRQPSVVFIAPHSHIAVSNPFC